MEELKLLSTIISLDGKWINVKHMKTFGERLPDIINQAQYVNDKIDDLMKVSCKCEIDQMRDVGISQNDFI